MSTIHVDHESWIGSPLIDNAANRLGVIEAIYYDQHTGVAQWMAVRTEMSGDEHCFVPVDNAVTTDDAVMTPYDEGQIEGAPTMTADEDLEGDRTVDLYRYYEIPYDSTADDGIVDPEPRMAATDVETQGEDDMRVATGDAYVVDADTAVTQRARFR